MKFSFKILRQNISATQLIGFLIANLVGLFIVLSTVQIYNDLHPIFFSTQSGINRKEYITVTKKLGLMSSLGNRAKFTPNEIEDLEKQDFINSVSPFVSSQYEIFTNIKLGQAQFGTEMFFESVPDDIIDIETSNWKFDEKDNYIPIILPKNYLDLYNFGFAEVRGLPKITEVIAGTVPLNITIYGKNEIDKFRGSIVGFSSRINTILVPMDFMEWSNNKFGTGENKSFSRLMIEVNDVSNSEISSYLESKGLQSDADKTFISKASRTLKMTFLVTFIVGIIICTLSLFIFILSISLLLEKNMEKINILRKIGYTKNMVCKPYEILISLSSLITFIISIILVYITQRIYSPLFAKVWSSYSPQSLWQIFLIGSILFLITVGSNFLIIRKKIKI